MAEAASQMELSKPLKCFHLDGVAAHSRQFYEWRFPELLKTLPVNSDNNTEVSRMASFRQIARNTAGVVSVMVLFGAGDMHAQRAQRPGGRGSGGITPPPALGARVGLDMDDRVWSIGGQVRFTPPFLPGLEIMPSGDVFLRGEQNEWQLNLDAVLQLLPIIYGGAGLAITRDSLPTSEGPSTETGYNLFLGLSVPSLRFPIKPFAEARWTTINRFVRPFRIVMGLNVPLGGSPGRSRYTQRLK